MCTQAYFILILDQTCILVWGGDYVCLASNLGLSTPRFYLAFMEKNSPIFLHGCEINSGCGKPGYKAMFASLELDLGTLTLIAQKTPFEAPPLQWAPPPCHALYQWQSSSNAATAE